MRETVLITGASSGIGKELALVFAVEGYNLITVARYEKALKEQAEILELLGVEVTPIPCDLSEPGAAQYLYDQVGELGKEVDILVNNAGFSVSGSFSETKLADAQATLAVGVNSVVELCALFVPDMIERGNGRVLNMGSMMGIIPCPYNALYGAAKAFVHSFTNALSRELEGTGVMATVPCPGAVWTNFPRNAGIEGAPAWKYFSMDAQEVAIQIYTALMKEQRFPVIGLPNRIAAWWLWRIPTNLAMKISEWLMGTRRDPMEGEGTGWLHADSDHAVAKPDYEAAQ